MMRLRPASVWCLALAAASAAPAAFSPKFHYQPTESANAVYHLACLASHIPCTKINFERFWHDDLHWTPADQRELDAWTGILTRVADAAPPPKPAPFIGNSAFFYPGLVAQREVIRALLESKTLADFQRRARPWLSRDAAARLRTAIEHFRARLKPWLESSGRSTLKLRPRQVEKDLRSEHVLALAAQMAAFVEAAPSIRDVHVHIIPGPVFESDAGAPLS